jgi:hypothetical protein
MKSILPLGWGIKESEFHKSRPRGFQGFMQDWYPKGISEGWYVSVINPAGLKDPNALYSVSGYGDTKDAALADCVRRISLMEITLRTHREMEVLRARLRTEEQKLNLA